MTSAQSSLRESLRGSARSLGDALGLPAPDALSDSIVERAERERLDAGELARLRSLMDGLGESFRREPPRDATSLDASSLAGALAQVAFRSEFVADALLADRACAELLLEAAKGDASLLARPLDAAEYRSLLSPFADLVEEAAREAVGRLKRWHAVRVALRDLLGFGDIEEWMIELSAFAEAAVEFAHEYFHRAMIAQHGRPMLEPAAVDGSTAARESACCVAMMGKGGGRELNFSSDIDVIFLYEGEGETEGAPSADGSRRERRIDNHKFFARLARRVAAFMGEPGPGGAAPYRVDLRLRPEGETGPLARGLPSFRAYFATQAELWERVAYAKARVVAVAGRRGFGAEAEAAFRDFVYAKFYDKDILGAIARLKRRIDAEAAAGELAWRDLKRGRGGIRELEFALAGYQQLYAGEHPELAQRRSAVWLIDALVASGLARRDVAVQWREDYLLLRRVEQRLQIRRNRQTHLLPAAGSDEEASEWRALWPEEEPPAILERLRAARERIRAEFDRLFTQEQTPDEPTARLLDDFHDPGDPAAAARLLAGLEPYGLGTPEALAALRRLRDGTRETGRDRAGREFFETVFPNLLRVASQAPSPPLAIARLESFLDAGRSSKLMLELLAEQPRALETLLRVFGAGDRLASILSGSPELLDLLLSDETLREEETPERDIAVFRRSLDRSLARASSVEGRKRALRRAARQAELKTGARWALGLADDAETSRRWTATARAALSAALQSSWRAAAPDDAGRGEGLAILALGKFATDELTFLSDLDVAFVAPEGVGSERLAMLTKVAEGAIDLLSDATGGAAWDVDARLRPTGRNAPLVAPLDYWRDYFREQAETWEFLAFARADVASGDDALGRDALGAIREAYGSIAKRGSAGDAEPSLGGQIAAMRERLAASVEPRAGWRDFKRAEGGIVDAEFAWQAAALSIWADLAREAAAANKAEAVADANAALGARLPNETLGAIGMSAFSARVDERLAEWLDADAFEAWRVDLAFLRGLETSTRLLRGRRDDAIPDGADPSALAPFAKAAGIHGDDAAAELIGRLDGIAERNRQALRTACAALDSWTRERGAGSATTDPA
jgi:glutamate-ammonia-ligase adenylyltransferase